MVGHTVDKNISAQNIFSTLNERHKHIEYGKTLRNISDERQEYNGNRHPEEEKKLYTIFWQLREMSV